MRRPGRNPGARTRFCNVRHRSRGKAGTTRQTAKSKKAALPWEAAFFVDVASRSAVGNAFGAAGFEPGLGFGFLRGFGSGLGSGIAFGAQFLDQRLAVAAEALVLRVVVLDAGLLRCLGDERVKFALRAQAER